MHDLQEQVYFKVFSMKIIAITDYLFSLGHEKHVITVISISRNKSLSCISD